MVINSKHKNALLTLQNAGLSKTSQRIAVLNILLKATKPLNVSAIRQSLKKKANKVTIYRILSLFRQRGIIREIASAGGANYFEMASFEKPLHPHFCCRNCGEFTCLEPLSFTRAPELILSKDDYSIDHIEINISGLCSDCLTSAKTKISLYK
ncbi:MAG: Fur family transcriptional regulator [Smithella sp.]